jgi:hypothetical protein
MGNAALLSLNYLANKVVNRYPDDRIRLAVLPAADERLYLESLEEHQRRARAHALAAPLPALDVPGAFAPPAEPIAAEVVDAAVAVPAAVEPDVPAKRGRGRKPKASPEADIVVAPAVASVEIAPALMVPASPAPAPVVSPPAPAAAAAWVAPVPQAAPVPAQAEPAPRPAPMAKAAPMPVMVEPERSSGRRGARKGKRSEEIIPPPSALPPEPELEQAPAPPPSRRRVPASELLAAPVVDDNGLRGPPRPRPRRSNALVEVVRVTKKT